MKRIVMITLVAVATSLLPAASVDGNEPVTSAGSGDPPTQSQLVRNEGSADGDVSTFQIIPSPSGCMGQSNNPHKASSVENAVKGFAFTRCNRAVPLIEVRAEVWKKRWYGYQHVGVDGYSVNRNDSYEANSGRYSPCENNTWRTVGQHHVYDHDRRDYLAETMRYAGVSC